MAWHRTDDNPLAEQIMAPGLDVFTYWGRDKMAATLQTTFLHIFLNENVRIAIKISLKFVP